MKNNSIQTRRLIFGVFVIISFMLLFFVFVFADREDPVNAPDESTDKEKYTVYPVELPEELYFAGERVPLDFFDVRESLDQELLINVYWQSHTMLLIKRANRYFPQIKSILLKNGVPEDMVYIPVAESDLTHAVSPSQAVGFWQFLSAVARENGLEVNHEVDERYHIGKSTEAACRFLKESYQRYGSWTMAAASYNMGRRGLDEQINRQKMDYYYDLLLNEETGRYIYRLLALKLIISDPGKYGFHVEPEDLYAQIPVYEVTLDGSVDDFADFASKYDINYKILKLFNPWLRDNKLVNAGGKTYYIEIPRDGIRSGDVD
jgi:membrane-bound lytic murein transglycosylase D